MKKSKTPLLLALGLGLLLGAANSSFAQKKYAIRGQVLDDNGDAIASVLVRVYRGNNKQGEFRTDANGSYSIGFDDGGQITEIRYDHSDWLTEIIGNISGKRNHEINKVLNKPGALGSTYAQQRYAATLARAYELDKANGVSDVQFREMYAIHVEKAGLPKDMLAGLPFKEQIYLPHLQRGGPSLPEVAKAAGTFKIFTQALELTGLDKILKEGNFTVFAPTDEAFGRLPEPVRQRLFANRDELKRLLEMHIFPANIKLEYNNLDRLFTIEPLSAPPYARVYFEGIRSAFVVSATPAGNGMLYGVNTVSLSPKIFSPK